MYTGQQHTRDRQDLSGFEGNEEDMGVQNISRHNSFVSSQNLAFNEAQKNKINNQNEFQSIESGLDWHLSIEAGRQATV